MSAPRPEDEARWLDRLAEVARAQEPPGLDAADADAMIARAITESGVRTSAREPRRDRRTRAWPWLAAAAAVCLAAGLGWALRPTEGPLHATLPSGDRIEATAGATFELLEATAGARRIAVRRGTVLFDVGPLGAGETFVVECDGTRVEVRGTVFSVERVEGHTRVRVYEGRVDVERGGRRVSLGAGRMWADGEARTLEPGPLGDAGTRAAARRALATRSEEQADRRAGEAPSPTAEPALTGEASASRAGAPEAPEPPRAAAPAPPPSGVPRAAPTPPLEPDEVRRWIGEGRVDDALAAARRQLAREPEAGAWRIVLGDALEASRAPGAAADAYDAAARVLPRGQAEHAAFLAATIRFRDLSDPAGARRSLDAARAAEPGSALEERALGLRARAAFRAGDEGRARRDAARYLAAFPEGSLAEWAADVLGGTTAPAGR